MPSTRFTWRHPVVALLLAATAPPNAAAQQGLSPTERETARAVADALLRRGGPLAERRLYAVRVELYRVKEGEDEEEGARQALVTHYQYQGDLAILTYVDLRTREALRQDTVAHLPVPLAPEELAEARKLALADSAVARALAPYGQRVVVEPLVVRTSDPTDPLSGQRVVRLLFRIGSDYLRRPIVTVNLSTREVLTEAEAR